MLDESLREDGKVLNLNTNGNGRVLPALTTLEALNVDDDFVSNLKGAYYTCAYFSNQNIERRVKQ
jgi:hypothetical protein